MKTPFKLAMIGALGVMTSVTTFAQPATGDDSSPSVAPRGRPDFNRPDPEAHRKVLLDKYDANKDGKLDDTELTALGKDVFEGKLPPPGRGMGRPDMRGGDGFGPPGRGGQGYGPRKPAGPPEEGSPAFGPPGERRGGPSGPPRRPTMDREAGPGQPLGPGPRGFGPSSEEGRKMAEAHRRDIIKKYDANNDGKLDSSEREAIGKDIEEGKLPPPPLPPQAHPPAPANEQQ